MGYLLRYIGEMSGIVFIQMAIFSVCIFMISWTPDPSASHAIFLMALGFSVSESVANGQIRGIYKILIIFKAAK
jgi:hypothetical protein